MEHLSCLTFRQADLANFESETQPQLECRNLVDVDGCDEKLALVLHSFPTLKKLSFSARHAEYCTTAMSWSGFAAIPESRQLVSLSLTGVKGMTRKSIVWLEAYFRAQQAIALAQPQVYVDLPAYIQASAQTRHFCINYLEVPMFCQYGFDERKPRFWKRFCAKTVEPWKQLKYLVVKDPARAIVTGAAGLLGLHTCTGHLDLAHPFKV